MTLRTNRSTPSLGRSQVYGRSDARKVQIRKILGNLFDPSKTSMVIRNNQLTIRCIKRELTPDEMGRLKAKIDRATGLETIEINGENRKVKKSKQFTPGGKLKGLGHLNFEHSRRLQLAHRIIRDALPELVRNNSSELIDEVQIGETGNGNQYEIRIAGLSDEQFKKVASMIEEELPKATNRKDTVVKVVKFVPTEGLAEIDDDVLKASYKTAKEILLENRWLKTKACIVDQPSPTIIYLIDDAEMNSRREFAQEDLDEVIRTIDNAIKIPLIPIKLSKLNSDLREIFKVLKITPTQITIEEKEKGQFVRSTARVKIKIPQSEIIEQAIKALQPGEQMSAEAIDDIKNKIRIRVAKVIPFPEEDIVINVTEEANVTNNSFSVVLKFNTPKSVPPLNDKPSNGNGAPTNPALIQRTVQINPLDARQKERIISRLRSSSCPTTTKDFVFGTDDKPSLGFHSGSKIVTLSINPTYFAKLKSQVESELGGWPQVKPRARNRKEILREFEEKLEEKLKGRVKEEQKKAARYLIQLAPQAYIVEIFSPLYKVRYEISAENNSQKPRGKVTIKDYTKRNGKAHTKRFSLRDFEEPEGTKTAPEAGLKGLVNEETVGDAFGEDTDDRFADEAGEPDESELVGSDY